MLTLSALKAYLSSRHNASISEMVLHFDTQADAVRGALAQWEAKGRVRKLGSGESCSRAGSCGCSCTSPDIYEWIEAPTLQAVG
jgi:putative ferrous iron transport protein C